MASPGFPGLALSPLALGAGAVLGFAWLVIEVGLVEEFFFRALVQERAASFFRSQAAGVVLMAVVFGLAHAPGLYLRTASTQEGLAANPSLLAAVGYSLVVTSVAGLFFGVLWARTAKPRPRLPRARCLRPGAQPRPLAPHDLRPRLGAVVPRSGALSGPTTRSRPPRLAS